MLQNAWPVLLKTFDVTENKDSLKNCHSNKLPKESWWLNVMWYLGQEQKITFYLKLRKKIFFGRWRRDRWERSTLPLGTSEMLSWSELQSKQPTVFQYIWRSEKKDRGHWKDQTVRRVLKDNKVPGTSAGPGCRVCCRILGREPGWAVWEARCLFGPGGLK